MFILPFFAAALATPPSSTLTGDDGTLSWTVDTTASGITIRGSSPKWTVEHTASADLTPIRTVHNDPDNGEVVVEFSGDSAVITRNGRTKTLSGSNLWDGDTVDIRLGAAVASGRSELAFEVVDPSSGKTYSMDSALVGADTCGASACKHVRVQLTGLLRYVGPTFHYWFGADGQLLRFEGPVGDYATQ